MLMNNPIQALASKMQKLIDNGNGSLAGGFSSVFNTQTNPNLGLEIHNVNSCDNSGDCSGSTNDWGCSNSKKCFTSEININNSGTVSASNTKQRY
jgi:hypothetical protein